MHFAGGPMAAQHWMLDWYLCYLKGIRANIAKEPYIFVIFQGGGGGGGGVRHARIQEFSSGGVQVNLTKKALATVFFSF